MKLLFAAILTFTTASNACAGSVATAVVAAMKLSEEPNYSWTCTVSDDAQTYDIQGKTEPRGYTWQRQPMPKGIARRLGRDGGRNLESIFKGTYRYVIRTQDGWKKLDELPKVHRDWNDDDWYYVSVPVIRSADMPADDAQFDPFGLPPAVYIPVLHDEPDNKVYSNAQFALALPHEELAVIVSSHGDFQVDGEIAAGTLTDLGARLLLVHDGHEYIRPVAAGGRFKLWMRDGTVVKYIVELAGILVVERKAVYVRQKSTTVLKDIGATTVDVPADARRRLDG